VLHLTNVDDAEVVKQATPSIKIVYFVWSESNPYPVKVTKSPPSLDPNLGLIDSSNPVSAPLKVTAC